MNSLKEGVGPVLSSRTECEWGKGAQKEKAFEPNLLALHEFHINRLQGLELPFL